MIGIIFAWVCLSLAVALGWWMGASIHGETEYAKGFAAGQEYQKMVEKGVIEP